MKKFIMALAIFLISLSSVEAAEIDSVLYLGDSDVIYPLIILDNKEAAAKINQEIRAEVKRLINTVNETMANGDFNSVAMEIDYRIPCNHDGGLLSIILDQFVNFEGTAHPSRYCRTLNFNSDSGERIWASSLTEIGGVENGEPKYSPNNITRKLRAYAEKKKIMLFSDFQGLENIPEEFYFDDETNVHFIFNQYEVAPYAVGIIDLNAAE